VLLGVGLGFGNQVTTLILICRFNFLFKFHNNKGAGEMANVRSCSGYYSQIIAQDSITTFIPEKKIPNKFFVLLEQLKNYSKTK